ncbi:MAG TPA: right-handed parallel beta-helix repeat-containing protein [Deltaproteobacteria bacterium]|nr:right-handed parallel beta-helix repeat-containing protein [Deltaproteobacteria bacterium]
MSAFISIEADHVQLDLNGFSILCSNVLTGQPCTGSPTGTDGIYVTGDQARIRNGSVRGIPRDGIKSTGQVYGTHVEDVRINDVGRYGILVESEAYVRTSTISGCGNSGIVVGRESVVVGNSVHGCGDTGFRIGLGSRVHDNVSTRNQGDGFFVQDSSLIRANTAYKNGNDGIRTLNYCTVQHNAVSDNGGFGMVLGVHSAYGENVITTNSQGTVSGGVDMSSNSCNGTTTCP